MGNFRTIYRGYAIHVSAETPTWSFRAEPMGPNCRCSLTLSRGQRSKLAPRGKLTDSCQSRAVLWGDPNENYRVHRGFPRSHKNSNLIELSHVVRPHVMTARLAKSKSIKHPFQKPDR